MEKLIVEAMLVIGLVLGSGWGVKSLQDEVRKELISALKRPSPSLTDFTAKLTRPK